MKHFGNINFDTLGHLNSLSGTAIKLLLLIGRDSSYPGSFSSGNIILITKDVKKTWATERNLGLSAINNSLTELVNAKYVRKIQNGLYVLNPNIIYKGAALNESKAIEEWNNVVA